MTTPLREEAAPVANELSSVVARPTHVLLLLVLPALLIFVAFSIRTTSGPYWYSDNLDPSYPYLLCGLNISNLHRPFGMEPHPGVPVQVIGATTIKVLNISKSRQAVTKEVLTNPEYYLRTINNFFIFLAGISLLIAGYVALRVTGSLFYAVVMQFTPFLSITMLQGLFGVRPEPFFISVSILFAALLLLTLRFDVRTYALRYSLAFGVLCGLGMASKLNFLPLLVIPLILLRSWKWKAIYAAITAVSFVIFIAPILAPDHLKRLGGFAVNVSTHTGRYGAGSAGIVDVSKFFNHARTLIVTDWLFFVILAASALALLWNTRAARLEGKRARILFAIVVAQLLQFLIVAKHPSSHYLIPALGLAGVNLILLFETLRPRRRNGSLHYRPALLTIICVGVVAAQLYGLKDLRANLRALAERQRLAHEKIEKDFRDMTVVDYYSASSMAYALKFGSEYSGNFYSSILGELYPNRFFYNPWTRQFSNFAGAVDLNRVAPSGSPFIMHGYSLKDSDFQAFLTPDAFPKDLTLEAVYRGDVDVPGVYDGEAIYKARRRAP